MAEQHGADGAAGFSADPPRSAFPAVVARTPRVVVRGDLASAFGVLAVIGVLGLALGWGWALLAPARRMMIADGGSAVPLRLESWHRFDGLALFLLLGLAAGILLGFVVWLLRARRGPVILLGAVAGSLLGAWLALRLGPVFAEARFAVPESPERGTVIDVAPVLESAWVVLAQPFATALTYGVLAAWNARDDLGRHFDRPLG